MSTLSVAFLTSFCIEIEPSEQVVWLWKSPVTYLPAVFAAVAMVGPAASAAVPMAAMAARAICVLLNPNSMNLLLCGV